uniref:Uncharacterized protein n=1 Tax=Populus alba TaxID=43335 RepID=A0A4U5NJG4_POPAL|nr:hypothetical protein D5086_0000268540 [Populus alba]
MIPLSLNFGPAQKPSPQLKLPIPYKITFGPAQFPSTQPHLRIHYIITFSPAPLHLSKPSPRPLQPTTCHPHKLPQIQFHNLRLHRLNQYPSDPSSRLNLTQPTPLQYLQLHLQRPHVAPAAKLFLQLNSPITSAPLLTPINRPPSFQLRSKVHNTHCPISFHTTDITLLITLLWLKLKLSRNQNHTLRPLFIPNGNKPCRPNYKPFKPMALGLPLKLPFNSYNRIENNYNQCYPCNTIGTLVSGTIVSGICEGFGQQIVQQIFEGIVGGSEESS